MAIEDPTGAGPLIWVNPVTELKTVKNRMHLDVVGDTAALQAAGATLLRPGRRDRLGRARRPGGQRVLLLRSRVRRRAVVTSVPHESSTARRPRWADADLARRTRRTATPGKSSSGRPRRRRVPWSRGDAVG
ncbi:VOC family protein [Geodermatophilus chilensis]|uniref:VOC family protein n=1 Tax=Geodermatophilus chilensis TaxID=2035835 RepID=UPI001E3C778D|nr:VOC family protein [Geodermatophilus chilensis]